MSADWGSHEPWRGGVTGGDSVGFGVEAFPSRVPNSPYRCSCRSAVMEAHVFWRFVGTMMCVATIFAVLVVCRQRVLDRKALEKVRKQIESI